MYPKIEEVAQRLQSVLEEYSSLMRMLQLRILLSAVEVIRHLLVAREPYSFAVRTNMAVLTNHRVQTIPIF